MGRGSPECTPGNRKEGSLEVDGGNNRSCYNYFLKRLVFKSYLCKAKVNSGRGHNFYSQVHTIEFHCCFVNSSLGIVNRSIVTELDIAIVIAMTVCSKTDSVKINSSFQNWIVIR